MEERLKDPIGRFGKITEQVLQGIVQSIEAAVVLHDRTLKVVFVNEAFERIFEIRGDEAIGNSPMDFLPEFDKSHREAILTRLQNTLRTGKKSPYHEFTYCSPSGRYRHLLAISVPILDGNRMISHVMSLVYDITERKELEREAVKAARLSSVAEMAYTLAHEINNPLTGIKLGLSNLYGSLKKEENLQILASVMKDLNRIQEIVKAFLKAKRGAPNQKEERISVLGDIIADVLFHLSGQLDRQKISVRNDFCRQERAIRMDREGIYRVILNLFLNAIQAMPRGGCIAISTEILSRSGDGGGESEELRISLVDSGPGIDPKNTEKIFKPFYSSKPGGTGLGLSICRDIVSAHGGSINIKGVPGQGTAVDITLPLIKG
ncbi:MAG: PAS domain S-box protein [Deltaproteobacteria bacterium]|nr:PAS domain S-box protein [Deltaproteobacteria bacterium]MBW2139111.1 PAS domain S-box protein [Deltaproteobacteria bacterium]